MSQTTLDRVEDVPTGFRQVLRSSTEPAHDALDHRMSRFDLTDANDRRVFCGIQMRAFARLGTACAWDAAEGTVVLHNMVQALLQEAGDPVPECNDAPICADAVAYLALGSQMGATVLRRGIPTADHVGFFGLDADVAGWRAFCARMDAVPVWSEAARLVRRDAIRGFEIFLSEIRHAKDTISLPS